ARLAMISEPFLASAMIFWSKANASGEDAVVAGAAGAAGAGGAEAGGCCPSAKATTASTARMASCPGLHDNWDVLPMRRATLRQRTMRTSWPGRPAGLQI